MNLFHCLSCGTEKLFSRNSSNKYCNTVCQQTFQYNKFIQEWKNGLHTGYKSGGSQISGYVRRYLLEKFNHTCQECKLDTWMGKPIPLEVEHIDGISDNSTEDNLTLLCANCHSQTPTYKAKNKGNGRHARRVRYTSGKSF